MGDPGRTGLEGDRLRQLKSVMEADIARGRYFGGVLVVARHGEVGYFEAVGHADEARTRPVRQTSVFSLFSVTKAFTNVLMFRAIERGQLALTTRVADVIPEFAGQRREEITFLHLLTHQSGMPSVCTPKPGMYIDRLDEMIAAICASVFPAEAPGVRVDYSPLVNHAMMGEAVRRLDPAGRSYRQMVQEDILDPLGMKDTSVGRRRDL
jgi:CubicO group peptidase (beta-lactamase class C family)